MSPRQRPYPERIVNTAQNTIRTATRPYTWMPPTDPVTQPSNPQGALMFTSMRLRDFKSWSDTGRIRLAPVTGFFGANSSGKSSLLHSFVLMKQTVQSSDKGVFLNLAGHDSIIDFGNYGHLGHSDFLSFLFMEFQWQQARYADVLEPELLNALFESTKKIGFSVKNEPTNDLQFRFAAPHDDTAPPLLGSASIEYQSGSTKVSYSRPSHQPTGDRGNHLLKIEAVSIDSDTAHVYHSVAELPPPARCYSFPSSAAIDANTQDLLRLLEVQFESKFFEKLFYLGPLRQGATRTYLWRQSAPTDVGPDGSNAIQALLAARDRGKTNARGLATDRTPREPITVEEHVSQWLQELGLASVFETRRLREGDDFYEVILRAAPDARQIPLIDVGFGLSQVLPVLVLLAYVPEDTTVLLEQPEMHLHPAAQAGLADILIEVAKVRNLQVLVESHSEHLLARLQRRVAEEVINDSDVALYFCRHDGHKSEITSLELSEFGEIQNWPENFFGDAMGEAVAMIEARARREE